MSPWQLNVLIAYGIVLTVWPIRHLAITWLFRHFDALTPDSPRLRGDSAPLVTAIIPAKDEEATLADCLDSVRAQNYPHLEILIVDDRSTDATAAIARRIAEDDPRVRVVTIRDLPPGWTGKNHALHVASAEALGAWLWYLDADTRHHRDCLAICLDYAEGRKAALASLVPELRCETFWEKVVQPLAAIVLMRSFPLFVVNDDRKRLGFANGQFILIRRDVYDVVGGHRSVRDRFVEDIYLAQRVKDLGLPVKVALGVGISSTRMYTSLGQIVRGWSRILYDACGRRTWPLLGKIIEPLVFSQTGDVALIGALGMLVVGWSGPFAWTLLGMSVLHQILKTSVLHRMYRLTSPKSAAYSAWYSLAGVVCDVILVKAIAMCVTGRVAWRGTSYGPGTVAERSNSAMPTQTAGARGPEEALP